MPIYTRELKGLLWKNWVKVCCNFYYYHSCHMTLRLFCLKFSMITMTLWSPCLYVATTLLLLLTYLLFTFLQMYRLIFLPRLDFQVLTNIILFSFSFFKKFEVFIPKLAWVFLSLFFNIYSYIVICNYRYYCLLILIFSIISYL